MPTKHNDKLRFTLSKHYILNKYFNFNLDSTIDCVMFQNYIFGYHDKLTHNLFQQSTFILQRISKYNLNITFFFYPTTYHSFYHGHSMGFYFFQKYEKTNISKQKKS